MRDGLEDTESICIPVVIRIEPIVDDISDMDPETILKLEKKSCTSEGHDKFIMAHECKDYEIIWIELEIKSFWARVRLYKDDLESLMHAEIENALCDFDDSYGTNLYERSHAVGRPVHEASLIVAKREFVKVNHLETTEE